MRLIFIIIGAATFASCSTLKNSTSKECNENDSFKKEFFKEIEKVEKYTRGNGDRVEFKNGLSFLSRYVKVSNDKMLNYNNSYTSLEDFENDKRSWMEWYKKNKCGNLQME